MILDTALQTLADRYHLDAEALRAYADEDDIGGYHTDATLATWPMGSLWAVEGQILYALVRALRPSNVLELGTYAGCSTAHLEAALKKNRKGNLTTVDNLHDGREVTGNLGKRVEVMREDAVDHLKKTRASYDLIFEDLTHETAITAAVWTYAPKRLDAGGMLISHDAMHHIVGEAVRAGIAQAGVTDALTVLVEPSDCGLAVWRA